MGNIGKRFAKPVLWEQPHFTELNQQQRLFWLFLNNRCDLAGVYQLHFPVDSAYLGFTVNQEFIDSFLEAINTDSKRLEKLEGRRLWLLEFVSYQQTGKNRKSLSAKAGPHISIVNQLKEHELLADAIDKDPELYSEFRDELGYNYPKDRVSEGSEDSNDEMPSEGSNYPKTTLSVDTRKGYSSSHSSRNSPSYSDGSSKRVLANNSNIASNVDNLFEPKGALFYTNLVKCLKQFIPDDALDGVSDNAMESDLKAYHDTLEADGIEDPKNHIITEARSIDWTGMRWNDFAGVLFETETPF